MRFLTICIATLCALLASLTQLEAQSLVPVPSPQTETVDLSDPLTPNEAESLISRLSDADVRQILLEQLGTKADGEDASSAGLSDFFYHATTGAVSAISVAIERLPILFSAQRTAFQNFIADIGTDGLFRFLMLFALIMLGAALVEMAFLYVTKKWRNLPPANDNTTLRETFGILIKRLAVEIVAVLVFIGAAIAISRQVMPENLQPYSSLIGFNLIALPRIAIAVGRFFMAPKYPDYRIVHASDNTARTIVFHNFWLTLLIGLGTVIVTFNAMNGVPMGQTRLGFWINLAVHLYLAILIWRYRAEMTQMMRGRDEVTPAEDWVARAYPIFGIAICLGTWWIVNILVSYQAFGLLSTAPHYKTMALSLFAPAMDTGIRGLVRHLVPAMKGEGAVAERAYESTKRSYIRIGRVIVFGIVLITIASFWGMTPATIASAGVGALAAARLIEFLIILSIGYLIYELVSLYINRKLAAEFTAAGYDPENEEMGGGDGGGAGGSRLSTVLPLILMVSRVAIVILFVLLALSNIGVDTTPLLAGAGIVGLAIGFGAQKLVTDVVSGIFFLVDDAFRIAEYVEVEGTMGTVEKISIRSMQLRHHKGPVHTIPYGEIPKLTNFSRDWVIMKLRFTVPFDTDPNKVKKIFKKIGQEMLEHEELGEDFLQPFKSQGVLEIDDVGMVIRGKFMAKPGKQFMIRKEIFNRVSAAFAENGIDFARREVRVALPGMEGKEDLTDEDKAAIAAAASQAAQAAQADGSAQKDDR